MSPPPRLRPAVRVVLVDPEDRVLLVRWVLPDRDVWGTPGGGIDPGENHQDAVRRELREETGWEDPRADPGPLVAHRVHVVPSGDADGEHWDGQEEWWYLLRVDAFTPRGSLTDEQLRDEALHELRWCTVDEATVLAEPRADRPVVTAPRALPDLLRRLVSDGHPPEPLELDV